MWATEQADINVVQQVDSPSAVSVSWYHRDLLCSKLKVDCGLPGKLREYLVWLLTTRQDRWGQGSVEGGGQPVTAHDKQPHATGHCMVFQAWVESRTRMWTLIFQCPPSPLPLCLGQSGDEFLWLLFYLLNWWHLFVILDLVEILFAISVFFILLQGSWIVFKQRCQ